MSESYTYTINIGDAEGGMYPVTFPDFPDLQTVGESPWECREVAKTAVAQWLGLNPAFVNIEIG